MTGKAQYKTRQMAELLAYLREVRGTHVTVQEICGHFRQTGSTVGTTTVYRNLERMVAQGTVAKYVIDGTNSAYFEYIGDADEKEHPVSYHCKCENCGKLFHFECEEVAGFGQHMLEHHGFAMDALKTVFYGVCGECRKTDGGIDR